MEWIIMHRFNSKHKHVQPVTLVFFLREIGSLIYHNKIKKSMPFHFYSKYLTFFKKTFLKLVRFDSQNLQWKKSPLLSVDFKFIFVMCKKQTNKLICSSLPKNVGSKDS